MFGGGGSTQLARVFGIRIGASPGWFLFLFLMIWYLSVQFADALPDASNTTTYGTAVAGALLFFLSIALHELGHAVGLAHTADTTQIMNATIPAAATDYGSGDLTGLSKVGGSC